MWLNCSLSLPLFHQIEMDIFLWCPVEVPSPLLSTPFGRNMWGPFFLLQGCVFFLFFSILSASTWHAWHGMLRPLLQYVGEPILQSPFVVPLRDLAVLCYHLGFFFFVPSPLGLERNHDIHSCIYQWGFYTSFPVKCSNHKSVKYSSSIILFYINNIVALKIYVQQYYSFVIIVLIVMLGTAP